MAMTPRCVRCDHDRAAHPGIPGADTDPALALQWDPATGVACHRFEAPAPAALRALTAALGLGRRRGF